MADPNHGQIPTYNPHSVGIKFETGLSSSCPLCGARGHPFFEAHGYPIRQCTSCRHRWAAIGRAENHVAEVYDDGYFLEGGGGYPNYILEGRILTRQGEFYARLLRRYLSGGSILDIGSAAGFILKAFSESGWEAQGIEPNKAMARYGRTTLGVEIENTTLEEFDTEKRFDAITMIQVISHFVDVRAALRKTAGLIRKDGLLLIEMWDRNSLTARLCGRRWHEYNPPSVVHWFSDSSLRRLFRECGLVVIDAGRPQKRIRGAHAKSLIRHQLRDARIARPANWILNLLPDSAVFPYPAEDLRWLILKNSASDGVSPYPRNSPDLLSPPLSNTRNTTWNRGGAAKSYGRF